MGCWERVPGTVQRHLLHREQLIELTTEQLGLTLANDPDGPPMWLPNNLSVREGVIDLVWVDPDPGTVSGLRVDDLGRVRSDHAVLRWELPLQADANCVPSVRRGSEEGKAYVAMCRSIVNALPLEYTSREHVEGLGNWLGDRLRNAWAQHATPPKPTTHSRSWWTRECTAHIMELRSLRLRRKSLTSERKLWKVGVDSSALLLDVAQFFPSVHHGLMAAILKKQGFNQSLCTYFENYLVGRQTEFAFNGHLSGPTDFSAGVGQGSALSPVLTGLYIAPILHLVAPAGQVLDGNATLQFFVDDGLIHVAGRLGPPHDRNDGLIYNNLLLRQLFESVVTHLGRLGLGVEVPIS